jgi:hypothetical protein
MPAVGENGVMLLMARIEKSSVPICALLTVASSLPSWPLGNRSALCLPPVFFSKAALKLVPSSHCVPPWASPTATLKVVAWAAPASASVVTANEVRKICLLVIVVSGVGRVAG